MPAIRETTKTTAEIPHRNERLRQRTCSPDANASECLSIYLNVSIANNCPRRATFVFVTASRVCHFILYVYIPFAWHFIRIEVEKKPKAGTEHRHVCEIICGISGYLQSIAS